MTNGLSPGNYTVKEHTQKEEKIANLTMLLDPNSTCIAVLLYH
jgi:hypothetical protein